MKPELNRRMIARLEAAAKLMFNAAVEMLENGHAYHGVATMELKDELRAVIYHLRAGTHPPQGWLVVPPPSENLPVHRPKVPPRVQALPQPPGALPPGKIPPAPTRQHVATTDRSVGCGVCHGASAKQCPECLATPTTREGRAWKPCTICNACGHIALQEWTDCPECYSADVTWGVTP